ncbi:MAG: DUF1697 domain-containing protein [Phycisphaerae bacterium]|nr:DUF1697 domain-containing protein [Phycisphaerae bacterium]
MPAYVALLRAVNVGGTGKLPMTDFKAMCVKSGWEKVQTYIASGNVVFTAKDAPAKVKAKLEKQLLEYAGKPVGVLIRTAEEIAAVLKANPFPDAAPNRTVAIFFDEAPPPDAIRNLKGLKNEQLRLGTREIYVHYGDGMADSTLVIPAAKHGTARNMNTVARLTAMAAAL